MAPTTVLLVAAPLVRWTLHELLRQHPARWSVVGCADGIDQALPAVSLQRPQVIAVAGEFERAAELADLCRLAPTVLVTSWDDAAHVSGALQAGVRGLVRNGDAPESFLDTLARVAAGERIVPAPHRAAPATLERRADPAAAADALRIASLTPRERDVIRAMTSSVSVPGKVIADRLHLSEHTLRNHLTSIYGKLVVSNRVELYAYAVRHHLLAAGVRDEAAPDGEPDEGNTP